MASVAVWAAAPLGATKPPSMTKAKDMIISPQLG